MIRHNLIPGSPEWHAFRFEHDGASEAAAMLGLSKTTTRTELLRMKATGIGKEFSDWVQKNILDYGHEVEALTCQIIEDRIGEELSPVTCSDGRLSASCDGLTFDGSISWEHKQANKDLIKSVTQNILPEEHCPQCYQNLMVTGAEKLLFSVGDGTRENTIQMWVYPDQVWFDRIRAGWVQFNSDRENYVHVEVKAAPVADAIMALPALSVQIKGEVTSSNLPVFINAAENFIAGIKTDLETDEDFANAEANVKACKAAEDGIEQTKKAITAQAVSIDEVMRTMDLYKEKLANVRLKLSKLVDSEKLKRKELIVGAARDAINLHLAELQKELSVRLIVPIPDFALAMKSLKKLSAMQEAVDTALRNGKFEADTIAKDLRHKLTNINGEQMKPYAFLFADLQNIIYKPADDFTLIVTSRIDAHGKAEAARLEAERVKMQAEEEAKARAKVEAELKVEREKIEREAQQAGHALALEQERLRNEENQRAKPQVAKSEQANTVLQDQVGKSQSSPPNNDHIAEAGKLIKLLPSHEQVILCVVDNFDISYQSASALIIEIAESLKVSA